MYTIKMVGGRFEVPEIHNAECKLRLVKSYIKAAVPTSITMTQEAD